MRRRILFNALLAAYVAALVAPVVGEFAGAEAYVGFLAGAWFVVYTALSATGSRLDDLHERVGNRPWATVLIVVPLVYGVAYVVGVFVAEPLVEYPYVHLGIWGVAVGVATVAVARTVGRGYDGEPGELRKRPPRRPRR